MQVPFPRLQLKSWNWIKTNWQDPWELRVGKNSRSLEKNRGELRWPFPPEKAKRSFFPLTTRTEYQKLQELGLVKKSETILSQEYRKWIHAETHLGEIVLFTGESHVRMNPHY